MLDLLKKITKYLSILMLLFCFTTSATGKSLDLYDYVQQDTTQQGSEVSEEELEKFVSILQTIEATNQEAQQEIIQAIHEQNMDPERFLEIYQSEMEPGKSVKTEPEEMEKYHKAMEKVEVIQVKAQQKVEKKVEAEGLSAERYQQIFIAIQQDPELQKKLQDLL